jgi:hypothetical protein
MSCVMRRAIMPLRPLINKVLGDLHKIRKQLECSLRVQTGKQCKQAAAVRIEHYKISSMFNKENRFPTLDAEQSYKTRS